MDPQNAANVSSGAISSPKYEKPKDKFFRQAKETLNKAKEIKMENHYNLRNYRLDNKKLRVGLPGEQKAIFYEKSFAEREKEDNKKLAKYVEEIYNGENNLKQALKNQYKTADKNSKREFSPTDTGMKKENFEKVKSIVIATAHEHIAQSQRLVPAEEGQTKFS